jgi:hypothetical protein
MFVVEAGSLRAGTVKRKLQKIKFNSFSARLRFSKKPFGFQKSFKMQNYLKWHKSGDQ